MRLKTRLYGNYVQVWFVFFFFFPSAVEGQDFTVPGLVIFTSLPNICISIGISTDTDFEGPEDFTVTLSTSDTVVSAAFPSTIVTITDNEGTL